MNSPTRDAAGLGSLDASADGFDGGNRRLRHRKSLMIAAHALECSQATPLPQARTSLHVAELHGILRRMETPVLAQSDFQVQTGNRLRRLIDRLGMSQVEAARIMGVSKHVLRNWLAGENPIGTYGLYKLCRIKGIDFNYVFLGDWHRLPFELAQELEAELAARLAGVPEPAHRDDETVASP